MSDTMNLTVRLDRSVKEDAEELFRGLGMTLSTAVAVFVRQALRRGGMPFEVVDPFYSASNQRRLDESIRQYRDGRVAEHHLIEA